MVSKTDSSFILHGGMALHKFGFCGQVHPSHSGGLLRLYAGKDDTGSIGVGMLEREAEARLSDGSLPDHMRMLAARANEAWDWGIRDKVIGPAAEVLAEDRRAAV